jgi:hypothetical protein
MYRLRQTAKIELYKVDACESVLAVHSSRMPPDVFEVYDAMRIIIDAENKTDPSK